MTEQQADFLRRQTRRRRLDRVARVTVLILLLAFWEISTRIGLLDPFVFSSPSRIAVCFAGLITTGEFLNHLGITLAEALIGLGLGIVIGLAIAILLWASDTLYRIFDPYLVVFNALPKIALGPVIIVWAGAGLGSIVVMTLLISVIVTVMGVLAAFRNTDPEKVLLLRSFGAGKGQIFSKLVFPSSLPSLISVLKINVGMTWIGVIMGEYLVSKEGLGYLIVYGGQVFKLDLVMTGVVVLMALAGGMYFAVAAIEKRVLK